jgi:hypothetical protein
LILVGGIRIQVGKNDHKKEKCEEMCCFEVLRVFFWGLEASPEAWTSFVESIE